MTFAEKRLRVIARKYSRVCETRTIGHRTCKGEEFWVVAPWSRSSVESTIYSALKEAALRQPKEGTAE